jgi:transcription initiation factor TFIIB
MISSNKEIRRLIDAHFGAPKNKNTENRIIEKETCEKCGNNLAFSDEGFLTCTNNTCGILCRDVLEMGPEWKFYGNDGKTTVDPTRCGMPLNPLLEQSSFSCKIVCSGRTSYEMHKIKKYAMWNAMPHGEKTLYNEFQIISSMARDNGISKMLIDCAIEKYKEMFDHSSYRGDNKDGLIAASIFIACKIHDCHRTPKEIAKMFNLDLGSSTKGCKNAQNIIIEIEKGLPEDEKTHFCKPTPSSFIERYCSKLLISDELTKLCYFVSIQIESENSVGEKAPHSLASGIIYFICKLAGLCISKKQISEITGISQVTVGKCCKRVEELDVERLVPEVMRKKYNMNNT